MKTQDLFEQRGNTSIAGVLDTIRNIYAGTREGSSPRLCHVHTARNIDVTRPNDKVVLYGFGNTVVHSALLRDGEVMDQYVGTSSTKLLPSGNLQINVRGNTDELEPVYSVSVGEFVKHI